MSPLHSHLQSFCVAEVKAEGEELSAARIGAYYCGDGANSTTTTTTTTTAVELGLAWSLRERERERES